MRTNLLQKRGTIYTLGYTKRDAAAHVACQEIRQEVLL